MCVCVCVCVCLCSKSTPFLSSSCFVLQYRETCVELVVTGYRDSYTLYDLGKGKGISRQAEVAVGVPGRLRPRIFTTFGTTRVVGRQPNAPAAFTPGEILGTHFQRLSRPQGTWFCRKEPRKEIRRDTTGDTSRDRRTSSPAP
jgi:hypothetical protein